MSTSTPEQPLRALSTTLRNDNDRDMGGIGAQSAPDQVEHTVGQHLHEHTRAELPLFTQHDENTSNHAPNHMTKGEIYAAHIVIMSSDDILISMTRLAIIDFRSGFTSLSEVDRGHGSSVNLSG